MVIEIARVRAIREAVAGLAELRGLSRDAERDLRRKALADFMSGSSAAWSIATAAKTTRAMRPNGPEAA